MTHVETLLKEFDQEAVITRKMLSIVPDDKYDWKPHPKSMTLRQLATHIAEIPGWATIAVTKDGLDFATDHYEPTPVKNTKELLDVFEKSYKDGRAHLAATKEATLDEPWVLRNGAEIYDESTKGGTVRMAMNQIIHHRAQLGVFLRLLNIPIPGCYGPSADEMGH